MTDYPITIPFSKTKLLALCTLSILICAGAASLLLLYPNTNSNQGFVKLVGIVGLIFFGGGAIFSFSKLKSPHPGMILTKEGIDYQPSSLDSFLPWSEITEIAEISIYGQKCIMVFIKNPEGFLNNIKNPIQKRMLEYSYKYYNTPISFSSSAFKITHNKLLSLLQSHLQN